jgi:hypothetical protein
VSDAITVACPSCKGARTIIIDHPGGRIEGWCPRCMPHGMTSHLTPDVLALTAEVERLREALDDKRADAVAEVVAAIRARPACGTLAKYENALADEIEREFLTDERRKEPS